MHFHINDTDSYIESPVYLFLEKRRANRKQVLACEMFL